MPDNEWKARQRDRQQKTNEWEERQREREKRQKEWEEKQKEREKKERAWANRVSKSKSHIDTIISMARSAEPSSEASSAFADMIIGVATGGISIALESLLGQRNHLRERAQYLKSCSEKNKSAWEYFSRYKHEMIGEDKAQASSALFSVRDKLNAAWGDLNEKKQKVNDSLQRAKEEKEKERAAKQAAWEERQRVKIEKQKIWEEKQKAWEDRQKIKAEKQNEWEARQKERQQKQTEWEARQRERERKQKEWEERQKERERKQKEWEERQRERQRRQSEWESRQRSRGSSSRSGGGRSGGGGKKDCYLTTACIQAKGLSDNCYELQILREFRDNILICTPIGKRAVDEYYELAPNIVGRINQRADSLLIWRSIYKDIIEAVRLIENGYNNEAFNLYKDMTFRLMNVDKNTIIPNNWVSSDAEQMKLY